jgi:hypothetical protein
MICYIKPDTNVFKGGIILLATESSEITEQLLLPL